MIYGEGRLAGKRAIVTAGASGIGRASVLRLARDGADVLVADINPLEGQKCVDEIRALGRDFDFAEVDVTSEDNVADAFDMCLTSGTLDVVVAAAAVLSSDAQSLSVVDVKHSKTSLSDLTDDQWTRVIDGDLTGAIRTLRASARQVVTADRGGSIVVTTSGASLRPIAGPAEFCVSKAGAAMLIKVMAAELASWGIRVNGAALGCTATTMTERVFDESFRSTIADRVPLGRMGQPDDVAYLASGETSFYTGKVFYCDGGVFSE